jgi:hypothetical protein
MVKGYPKNKTASRFNLVALGLVTALVALTTGCTKREVKSSSSSSTLPSEVSSILSSCSKCHSGASAPAGFNFVTDVNAMISAGLINPGNPEESVLYQKLSASPPYGSRMPFGGPYLSETEIQNISDWIGTLASTDEVAITTPSNGTFIDSSNNSAIFGVSGSCNVANATITVYVNTVSVGTATCDGANFSLTVDSTQTPFSNAANSGQTGANTMYATLTKSVFGVGKVTATSSDLSLPKNTNELSISLTSHLNSSAADRLKTDSDSSFITNLTNSASHPVTGTCNSSGRTVSIKVDETQVGTAICNGTSFSGSFDSTAVTDGNHKLSVTVSDSGGTTKTAFAYIFKWAAAQTYSFDTDIKPLFVNPVGANTRACIDCHYAKSSGNPSGSFAFGNWAACPSGGRPTAAGGACENTSATSAPNNTDNYPTTPSRNDFVFKIGYYSYSKTTAVQNEGGYASRALTIVNDKSDYSNHVANRIVRGNPGQSFIYKRILQSSAQCYDVLSASPGTTLTGCRTSQGSGISRMPAVTTPTTNHIVDYLDADQQEKIYTWILQGARTDN